MSSPVLYKSTNLLFRINWVTENAKNWNIHFLACLVADILILAFLINNVSPTNIGQTLLSAGGK